MSNGETRITIATRWLKFNAVGLIGIGVISADALDLRSRSVFIRKISGKWFCFSFTSALFA